jgi:hypothetical protein
MVRGSGQYENSPAIWRWIKTQSPSRRSVSTGSVELSLARRLNAGRDAKHFSLVASATAEQERLGVANATRNVLRTFFRALKSPAKFTLDATHRGPFCGLWFF